MVEFGQSLAALVVNQQISSGRMKN